MNRIRVLGRRRLLGVVVMAAAATLLLTGVATALAAGNPSATPSSGKSGAVQSFMDRLAQNLGISTDKLNSAVKQTDKQMIDDAAANGKLSQQQADQLKQKIDSAQGEAPFLFGIGGGRGLSTMGPGIGAKALAGAIGISPSQLSSELQSGKTLKDIITEHGKTVEGVVNDVINQVKTKLDQAMQSEKLSQDQVNQILDQLKTKLTDAINNNSLGDLLGGHGPSGGGGGMFGGSPNQRGTHTHGNGTNGHGSSSSPTT